MGLHEDNNDVNEPRILLNDAVFCLDRIQREN